MDSEGLEVGSSLTSMRYPKMYLYVLLASMLKSLNLFCLVPVTMSVASLNSTIEVVMSYVLT